MCNRIGNIFGALAATSQVNSVHTAFDSVQLGVLFDKVAICTHAQAQFPCQAGGILAR